MAHIENFKRELESLSKGISDKDISDDGVKFLYDITQELITFITQKIKESDQPMTPTLIRMIAEHHFPKDIAKHSSMEGMKLVNSFFTENKEDFRISYINLFNFKNTRYYYNIKNEITEAGTMLIGMIQYILEDMIDMASDEDVITSDRLKEIMKSDKDFKTMFITINSIYETWKTL